MIIHPLERLNDGSRVRLQAKIDSDGQQSHLWYEIDARYQPYLTTETLDSFLVGMLLLAMKRGQDIQVEGAISERLYYNLTHYYMHLLTGILPEFRIISIKPRRLSSKAFVSGHRGVAAGFSAGVDSFFTVLDHLYRNPTPAYTISHLLFNNVGAHAQGTADGGKTSCDAHYNLVRLCGEELELELVRVDSNLDDVLEVEFIKTHAIRNVAGALLLQKLFSKFFYASGDHYRDCTYLPLSTGGISHMDPAAIHLLSTETTECISSGCQMTRVEKTEVVSQYEIVTRHLNVCVRQSATGGNCSLCWKCCRTLFTLELLGRVERFSQVFDLNRYRRIRYLYLCTVIARKKDEYMMEIFDYANNNSFSWPCCSRFFAQLLSLLPKAILNRLLGGFRWLILRFSPKERSLP